MKWIASCCLFVLAAAGCNIKELQVHYEQVATCESWSDESDDRLKATQEPLAVFRIKKIENVSGDRMPSAVFDLRRVYWEGDGDHYMVQSNVPQLQAFILTLATGEIRFVSHNGLFAVQLEGENLSSDALRNLSGQLQYNETSGLSVEMIRDESTSSHQEFLGKSQLAGL